MNTKYSKAAEALFRKQDMQAALSDYEQRRIADHEKSARLRALRLAKEAVDCEAAAQAAASKAVAKKPVAKRRKKVAAMKAASA